MCKNWDVSHDLLNSFGLSVCTFCGTFLYLSYPQFYIYPIQDYCHVFAQIPIYTNLWAKVIPVAVSVAFEMCRPLYVLPCTVGPFICESCSWLSDHSDGIVSPPVTCVDAVTVHLHSQCSGACSDVQETAEVQSWAERWWVVQHPSAVPVPPVKQGCCLPPCRERGQCQSRSRRGETTNKVGGGEGREDAA